MSKNITRYVGGVGGLTYPHLRADEEMKRMRSMTNTFDFPLMSVSALNRHTSNRSSLTETARLALFYESQCISKNNLTAESKGVKDFEATHAACPPLLPVRAEIKIRNF